MSLELEIARALSSLDVPAVGSTLEYELEQALSHLWLPGGGAPALPLDGAMSYDRVRKDNIEVAAQHALVRMSKSTDPMHRQAAHAIAAAIDAGRLGGVWREDQQAPALRQKAVRPESNWMDILRPGEDAVILKDPLGAKPPLLVYGRAAAESPPRLDAALARVARHPKPRLPKPVGPPCLPKPCPAVPCLPSEYKGALGFIPAARGNYGSIQRNPKDIDKVVIHITDAPTFCSTVHAFQNPKHGTSAHYVVDRNGDIVQMVKELHKAEHAHAANGTSIGIEHFASPGHPERPKTKNGPAQPAIPRRLPTHAQYCSSSRLVRYLCRKYDIPMDSDHIVGHAAVDPKTANKSCPDSVWNWGLYWCMLDSASCRCYDI